MEASTAPMTDPCAWRGHVIVCGLGGIGLRTLEQLRAIGIATVALDDAHDSHRAATVRAWDVPLVPRTSDGAASLAAAGLAGASAVVCAEGSDLRTLETALLVRDLRPEVRVVVHLDNQVVGRAVEEVTGAGGVLDVAGLFAPAVVDGCLRHDTHELELDGQRFVAVEVTAERTDSLRALYGDLAPIGAQHAADEQLVVCPGRDHVVMAGDRVTLLGDRGRAGSGRRRRGPAARRSGDARRSRARQPAGARPAERRRGDRPRRARRRWSSRSLGMLVSALVLHAWLRDGGRRRHGPAAGDLLLLRDGRDGRLRRLLVRAAVGPACRSSGSS